MRLRRSVCAVGWGVAEDGHAFVLLRGGKEREGGGRVPSDE